MDIATLIGLVAGVVVVAAAVAGGNDLSIFVNVTGMLIVLGGTTAAVLIKFPLRSCLEAFIGASIAAFVDKSEKPQDLIATAAKLADMVRKRGMLALEETQVDSRFFQKGITFIVDGYSPELIRKAMQMEMHQSIERHQLGERVFRAIGESAPAFGMIGTLVGLVQMLVELDDPSKIGVGMAVALLTTLYGALIANLVALPIADKLQMRAQQEFNNKELIVESLLQIQQKQNPRVLRELLFSYMPDSLRQPADREPVSSQPDASAGSK